jgi:hypothetical protein
LASVIIVEQLIESVSPTRKRARQQDKPAYPPSIVEKYKARLTHLQEQARRSVPLADEKTLNIRFDS